MKKITKLILAATIMAAAMPSAAQSIIVNNQLKSKASLVCRPNIDMSKYEKRTLANGAEVYSPHNNIISKNLNMEESNVVNVTFLLSYDQSLMYAAGSVMIAGNNSTIEKYMDYDDESGSYFLNYQLPRGTYDFASACLMANNAFAYNVKELVEINNDTTITFDFAESNIKYCYKSYKPNGEEATIDEIQFDENWEVLDTIAKGNSNLCTDDILLVLKGHGVVARYIAMAAFVEYGKLNPATLYINSLSDRYKLSSGRYINDANGKYIIKYDSKDMSETLLQNDPNNYILYEEEFQSIGDDDNGLFQGLKTVEMIGNVAIGGIIEETTAPIPTSATQLYVDPNREEGEEKSKFEILICPEFCDNVSQSETCPSFYFDEDWNIVEFIDTVQVYRTIQGTPVLINNDGSIEYVNSGQIAGDNSFLILENGNIMGYPGHPQFSFVKGQKPQPYGSSTPIVAVMTKNTTDYYAPGKNSYISPCFIGRYGEIVRGYFKTDIRYNDSIISKNCLTLNQDLNSFSAQGNPDGVITAHFENTNAVVDGLQGKNTTDVYYDQRNEDWTAPTLQMLQFKDADGNITDRFDNAEDGILEFAGGDFNYNKTKAASWFDCKGQTVEVSYAPYGGTNWETLEVNEIPENFYMPGFGYFYRGSLQNIEGEGWFDLKIKLTDLSGNWQEQTISPAFRIGDAQTGIGNVKVGNATEVARYTVDGRAISAPQSGVNIVKMSDGSVKKVWVK